MLTDESPSETQLRTLRALIEGTYGTGAHFAKERETFAEGFSHTCGHNRLEQIGLRWSSALTPSQTRILATDPRAATGFAAHLHQSLMRHLLPDENEMAALPKPVLATWITALRMGFQGVLRRRAYLSGQSTGQAACPQPDETFLLSMQPTIRHAADEFFQEHTGQTA